MTYMSPSIDSYLKRWKATLQTAESYRCTVVLFIFPKFSALLLIIDHFLFILRVDAHLQN